MKERLANNIVVSLGIHLGVVAIFAFATLFAASERVPFGAHDFVMVEISGDGNGSDVSETNEAEKRPAQKQTRVQPTSSSAAALKSPTTESSPSKNSSSAQTGGSKGLSADSGTGAGSGSASGTGSFGGSPNGDPTLAKIRTKIERAKFYPAEARSQKLSGKPKVEFEIATTGEIKAAKIVVSSGSAILDKAAIDTIYRAKPLPYFPEPIKLAIIFDAAN